VESEWAREGGRGRRLEVQLFFDYELKPSCHPIRPVVIPKKVTYFLHRKMEGRKDRTGQDRTGQDRTGQERTEGKKGKERKEGKETKGRDG
jgi:hypothetical protein